MTKFGSIVSLLPPETYVILIMLAGIALMLGARRVAAAIGIAVACGIFLPVIIEPFLNLMPLWLLILGGIVVGLAMLRAISSVLIGERSTDHMVGALAADGVKAVLRALFWPLVWLIRTIFRRR